MLESQIRIGRIARIANQRRHRGGKQIAETGHAPRSGTDHADDRTRFLLDAG